MSSENESNFFKFEIYFSNIVKKLESTADLNNFSLYLTDVSYYCPLDSSQNRKLMEEISIIIKDLEALILSIGYDDSSFKGKPWIEDKINYCLNECKDTRVLSRLNDLYSKYIEIRKIVISGNLRLVILIAKEYFCKGIISFEDIIQYGNIGLMRAVEKYDITKGTTFASYACRWIKQSITKNIRNIKYPTWIPLYVTTKYHDIIEARNDLSLMLGREPNNNELAQYMNVSVDFIDEITTTFLDPVSLDEPLDLSTGDVDFTRQDLIEDEGTDVFEIVANN